MSSAPAPRFSPTASCGLAAGCGALVGVLAAALIPVAGRAPAAYGLMLFVGTPLVMGIVTGVVLARLGHSGFWKIVASVVALFALAAGLLLVFGVEGAICLLMATPLAFPLVLLMAVIGHSLAERNSGVTAMMIGLMVLPLGTAAESRISQNHQLREVVSTVEIDAPPDRVWQNVIAFPPLPEPTEWWFRAGIAYPRYASIDGAGVGATRVCVFSTGPFVEPITHWEPGVRLAFDVTSSPAPMRELSPYSDLHPPHFDGYLRSRRGEFRLIALPNGRTRLEGSTWYELDMAPAPYWMFISDRVIHSIHGRVLAHIKRETERTR
jgi:hypothetical protein